MKRIWKSSIFLVGVFLASRSFGYEGEIWHGRSNNHGGVAEYSVRPGSNDYSESQSVRINCYAFDKSIRIVIRSVRPEGFDVGDDIYFYVDDNVRQSFYAELAHWGYWGAMPSAWIDADLLKQIMKGKYLEIKLQGHEDSAFYELDLTGTQKIFSRHLSACLK